MDAGSILLVLALTIAVIAIIARPFVFSQENQRDPRDHAISALRAEHEQILTILQEMELDHVMGKINDADYQALRQETLERGADVLRKLDDLGMTADDPRKMEAPREPDPLGLEWKQRSSRKSPNGGQQRGLAANAECRFWREIYFAPTADIL